MSHYNEQLKDERWKKLKKSIVRRDKGICRCCCASNRKLHVHHLVYFKGLSPWEYSKMYLVTLCDDCHEQTHRGRVLVLTPRTRREAGTSPKITKARMEYKKARKA